MTTATGLTWDTADQQDIPPLVKTPSPMQLFMFSAITWNRHLIHYNTEFAISDGLEDIAVHRALIGGFLAQTLTNWLNDSGGLLTLEWSVRGSAAINRPLACYAKVVGKRLDDERRLVDCEVWVENHRGATISPGKAVVEFWR